MNLQTAIYNKVLEPKYLKVYLHIEEMKRTSNLKIKNEHLRDIANIISDIIVIKEKYKIPFMEDIELLQKYKK